MQPHYSHGRQNHPVVETIRGELNEHLNVAQFGFRMPRRTLHACRPYADHRLHLALSYVHPSLIGVALDTSPMIFGGHEESRWFHPPSFIRAMRDRECRFHVLGIRGIPLDASSIHTLLEAMRNRDGCNPNGFPRHSSSKGHVVTREANLR